MEQTASISIDAEITQLKAELAPEGQALIGKSRWLAPLALLGMISIPIGFFTIMPMDLGGGFGSFALCALWMIIALIPSFYLSSLQRDFETKTHRRVAKILEITYHEDGDSSLGSRARSERLFGSYNKSNFSDKFAGTHQGIDFSMTQASLKRETGSGKDKKTTTVFVGHIARLDCPKRIEGRVLIGNDGGWLGNMLGGIGKGQMERVKLEDPAFEKSFEVYATDQVAARYLLTPTFMQRLLDIRHRNGGKMVCACNRGALIFAISAGMLAGRGGGLGQGLKFMFGGDPNKLVDTHMQEAQLCLSLIDGLKLDPNQTV